MPTGTYFAVMPLILEDHNATGGLSNQVVSPFQYATRSVQPGQAFVLDVSQATQLINTGHIGTSAAHASAQSLLWPKDSRRGPVV